MKVAEHAGKAQLFIAASAIIYFAFSSSATQFSNKALFTTFGFGFPLVVAAAQTIVIIPTCYIGSRPKIDLQVAWGVAPIAVCNMLNVIFGLMGTAGLSVPMFICLRRFVFLFTIAIERFLFKKTHDRQTLMSIGLMIFGSAVAATTDPSFNLYGYISVLLNDVFSALNLVLVKNNATAKKLSSTELLFYNSSINFPALMAIAYFSGQWTGALNFKDSDNVAFRITFAASCLLGLTLNHATFVCTRATSPLTVSVTGSFKNIFMTLIGMVAFGDFKFALSNLVGLTISAIGATWYATYTSLKSAKAAGALPPSASTPMLNLPEGPSKGAESQGDPAVAASSGATMDGDAATVKRKNADPEA